MKKFTLVGKNVGVFILLFTIVLFSTQACAGKPRASTDAELKQLVSNVHWLGHDAFRIEGGGLVIYIDPFMLKADGPKADLILTTHDHADHASPLAISKIKKPETVFVTVAKAADKFTGDVRIIKPGDSITVKGINIKAIPAYNINKFRSPGVPFHPKESGYVGYIITVNDVRIYHAGDTDFIPEMKGLKPDVALLPVSGIYTMTAEEAVEAAAAIKPKVAIPMHVGGPVGVLKSAEDFKAKATVPVMILPIEP